MNNFYFIPPILAIISATLNISLASDKPDNFDSTKENSSHLVAPVTDNANDEIGNGQLQQFLVQVPQVTSIWHDQFAKYSNFMPTSSLGGGGWPPKPDIEISELLLPKLNFSLLTFNDQYERSFSDKDERREILGQLKLLLEKDKVPNLTRSKIITNQDKVDENPLWSELRKDMRNVILSFLKPSDLCALMRVSHASYNAVLHLDMRPFLTSNIHPKVFLVNQAKMNENPLWPILYRDARNVILNLLNIANLHNLRQVSHASYNIVSDRVSPFLTTHCLRKIIGTHVLNKNRENTVINWREEQKYLDILMRLSLRYNPDPINTLYCFYDIMRCSSSTFKKSYKKFTILQYFEEINFRIPDLEYNFLKGEYKSYEILKLEDYYIPTELDLIKKEDSDKEQRLFN